MNKAVPMKKRPWGCVQGRSKPPTLKVYSLLFNNFQAKLVT